MKIYRVRSFDEYQQHAQLMQSEYLNRHAYEKGLLPRWRKKFKVQGYSYTAKKTVKFHVDYLNQSKEGTPNWRERIVCPVTRLNNRMRASVHLFEVECGPYNQNRIYISEQVTPLYKYFADRYPNITGSEFMGETFSPGSFNATGIRHEDLTNLSFKDDSFDHVLSFDCFEHIPNYPKAISESFRILTNGGTIFFSVPFSLHSPQNITRARVTPEGTVEHLMEPEYHGDPMNKTDCLCYQYFGWEMFNDFKKSGFKDVYAMLYWSKDYCYLGGEQVVFVAKK